MINNLGFEVLKIYGFGSFFSISSTFNDIDILIIHETFSKSSCQAAIKCKYLISSKLENADITILSIKEENSLKFILRSKAILLGEAMTSNLEKDIATILDNKSLNLNNIL